MGIDYEAIMLKEYFEKVKTAFVEVLNKNRSPEEIQKITNLPINRCEEISYLYHNLTAWE